MSKEFKLKEKDDVVFLFGKYKDKSLKEIATSFKGMMYIKWVYNNHTRITDEVKERIELIWKERNKEYIRDYTQEASDRAHFFAGWNDDRVLEVYLR